MNNIIKNTIKTFALGVLLILGGCSFLDMDNPSSVSDDYYDTAEGQQRLLYSITSHYRNVFNTGELQYYGTDMYMAVTESINEKQFNGYDKTFNASADILPGYWKTLYKIVQESNTLLNRCSPQVTGDDYESFIAQGRFFRAMAYYYLVETFGDVPLYTEENKDIIESTTRIEEDKIYEFMIEEMEEILDVLPAKASMQGELSNTALLQFTGKLYLTRAYKSYAKSDDFDKAALCFDSIIDDPQKNYYLLPRFEDVFSGDNQDNDEIIWAIQYGTDKNFNGGGNPQHLLFGFNISALLPEYFGFIQSDYSLQQRGYWVNPRVHEWFTNPEIDSRYDATFKREFYINVASNKDVGELGLYFPRWNDTSGDDKGAVVQCVTFKNEDGDYLWYPNSTAIEVLKIGTDYCPMVKKFAEPSIEWGGKGTREDIVMRVGDTYLLSAEAHLGAGDDGKALERINDLRRRAAVDEASESVMKLDAISIEVLLEERGRELLGEHDRWFDLKRTGRLLNRAYEYNIFVEHYNNMGLNHLLRPIPQDEIDKVDGLTQNLGYN